MGISNVKIDDQDYWTRLQGFYIKMWESKKHAEEGQNPEHVIPINKVSWQLSRYVYLSYTHFIISIQIIFSSIFVENIHSII